MPNLLLEVGTEELPARFVDPARLQLETNLREALVRERLEPASLKSWATPRRLAVRAEGLPAVQPDVWREVRGPAARAAFDAQGRPTAAALGFARSQGVPVEALEVRSTPAGEYVFARVSVPGKPVGEVLRELLPRVVASLQFPKTMRWGNHDLRFARPIRWLVALLDDQVVPFELAGVRSGRWTYGHRQLAPGPHEIPDATKYEEVTCRAWVMADRTSRREEVVRQVQACAREAGWEAELPEELVDEVTDLVEWPTAFLGWFDPRFLELPEPVLVTVMRHHQRYFPVRRSGGLGNAFVGVRNGDAVGLDLVREGNEWVLRARLVDAGFFYQEDRKRSLEEWARRLESVTFHERLGSMREKTDRLVRLCGWLAEVSGRDPKHGLFLQSARQAARICKADLATHLVREFPELQGTVGAIYARLEGFLPDVCEAVDEHYRPRGAQDAPPRTELGALLAVADRADTLAGFVGVGILPTGSADPYGLRRAASALLDVLYAHRGWLQVDLGRLVEEALQGYGARPDFEAAPRRLAEFLGDRVRAWLLERGFAHDVVDAVLECWRGRVPDFLDALARVEAVAEFRDGPHFPAAYEAFDRAYRIWDKQTRTPPSAPGHPAERGLADAVRSLDPRVTELARGREYRKALELLAQLRGPVAGLFDAVLVNDPDPHLRARRHALLGAVVDLFWKVAHFEHLVVAREA